MEVAVAAACKPSKHGTIEVAEEASGAMSFRATFKATDESVSRSFSSLVLCIGWIGQMEASLKAGQLRKGLSVMQKKLPGAQVSKHALLRFMSIPMYIYDNKA